MPEKTRRPVGVKSTPVRVSLDELATELVRRFPEESILDALLSASLAADKRLRDNRRSRHDQYHAKLFFRRLAQRLPHPTDELAVAVGMKDASRLKVQAATETVIDLAVRVKQAVEGEVPPDEPPPVPESNPGEPEQVDEFAGLLDIPTFEDYAQVFERYPYALDKQDEKRNERLLVLGYASGRDSADGLIIRNCVLVGPEEPPASKGTAFNDLVSVVGILKRSRKNVRQFIKVVPYRVGAKVRFWHHVRGGGGDKPEWNRHIVLTEDGLKYLRNRNDWDEYVHTSRLN